MAKKRLTKEEIGLIQAKKRAITEDICYFFAILFSLTMLAVSVCILYLMLNYKW